MLYRLRAWMRFPTGHWGPQWCYDQMTVRYGQAVHIRQGELAEEVPINVVEGDLFYCDLPLMDQIAAQDALATLSDPNVLGQTIALDNVEGTPQPSWVEYHFCDHDENVRDGCQVVERNHGEG